MEDRKGHDRRYGIAPDKIKKDLGWEPETSFEVGIVKTIQWYLANPEWSSMLQAAIIRAITRKCMPINKRIEG